MQTASAIAPQPRPSQTNAIRQPNSAISQLASGGVTIWENAVPHSITPSAIPRAASKPAATVVDQTVDLIDSETNP